MLYFFHNPEGHPNLQMQVIGSVNTILTAIYGSAFKNSPQRKNVASIAFVGTVVGQLVFGVLSDYWSRKWSLIISTCIMIVFSALSAGSYGAHGTLGGMLAALTAYRFLVGIGIGGEYPAGSVAASEGTAELKAGHRNRWFVFATNFMIDMGFAIGTLVPMIVVLITTEKHLRLAWRICLGVRSHSPYHSPRFPLSAQGTRGVQSSENDKVPIRADYPLLLETPPYHLYDLVHLRFPRLFVWYLLQFLAVLYHWGFVPTLGLVRLVDTYQFLLYPGRFHWCFPQ
jgi:MFS family permease